MVDPKERSSQVGTELSREQNSDAKSDFGGQLEALLERARTAGRLAELKTVLERAAREAAMEAKGKGSIALPNTPSRFGIIGDSPAMQRVFHLIERVAASNVAVLVQGETGSGKELVARALHEASPRRDKPFLAENCAAVPATLLESELFGHVKGAFTDAVADREGYFTAADKGTVFLDEIGDMPLEMQSKLLRVLQEGEVRPVGGNQTHKVDVRVIAATNRDLEAMSREGGFRQDLFYRLNVITIALPPLREREGDVAHLLDYYLATMGRELGFQSVSIRAEARAAMEAWSWPGNVRELQNELQRALALGGGMIELSDLSPQVAGALGKESGA